MATLAQSPGQGTVPGLPDADDAARWDDLASGFAAIGAPARLRVIRLLVRAGSAGLPVGEIGDRLGIAPSTLAHHLRALADGGLIEQRREGRQTLSHARFDRLQALSAFILAECCVEDPDDTAAGLAAARETESDHG